MLTPFAVVRPVVLLARCAPGLASGALFEAPPSLVARRELLAPQSRRRRAPPARCAPGLASGALFEAPPARCASGSPSVAGGRALAGGGAGHGQPGRGHRDQLGGLLPRAPEGRPVPGVGAPHDARP